MKSEQRNFRFRLCEKPALNCGPHGRMVRVGTLRNGFSQACRCDPGWTGSLCDTSETGCYPPDCNGKGFESQLGPLVFTHDFSYQRFQKKSRISREFLQGPNLKIFCNN